MTAIVITSLIFLAAFTAIQLRKIDLPGAVAGILVAHIIWLGSGHQTLLGLLVFFIAGTAATSWRKTSKAMMNLDQERDGLRGIVNVLANGGAAAIFSAMALLFPWYENYLAMMALAGLATVCSDTLSSELGNIYGSRYYDILSFKKGQRGVDGIVSNEGLCFGIAGSVIVATCMFIGHGNLKLFLAVSISGVFGNLIDSVLGATLQRRGIINNHLVNFIASLCGAFFFLAIWLTLA